jgi:SSS family transporter
LIIGVITIIYSYQGGMKAVIWGDVIQMLILFGGIVLCLAYGLSELGGWNNFTASVDPDRLKVIDFSSMGFAGDEFGFWPMVIGGFFLYASYYGTDQSQTQRQLSADSMTTIRQLLVVNGLFRFPVTLVYCIMGLILGTLIVQDPSFMEAIDQTFALNGGDLKSKADLMVPVFILNYLPHGIIGILFVAILSAAMSSLSSAINSLSAVTMEDFVKRFKPDLSNTQYIKYSKGTSLFWGIVCLLCAFFAGNIAETVIEAINKIGSVFYGPILAAFILAILTKRTTAMGVNIGIIAGVGLNVYLWQFVPEVFWFWWNAIGAATTIIVGYGLSLVLGGETKEDHDFERHVEHSPRNIAILIGFFLFMIVFCLLLPGWLGS